MYACKYLLARVRKLRGKVTRGAQSMNIKGLELKLETVLDYVLLFEFLHLFLPFLDDKNRCTP